MNTTNLTAYQDSLINNLKQEFAKLNPPMQKSDKKFSIQNIQNYLDAENKFVDSIRRYNEQMFVMLEGKLESDLQEVRDEFGSLYDINDGCNHTNPKSDRSYSYLGAMNSMMRQYDQHKGFSSIYGKFNIYFVSKNRIDNDGVYSNSIRMRMAYLTLDAEIDYATDSITMQDGRKISLPKIKGITYRYKDSQKWDTIYKVIENTCEFQDRLIWFSKPR